jgi:hypothetical protein
VAGQLDPHPEQPTALIRKAPFQLPPGFFQAFGYQGGLNLGNSEEPRFIHRPEVWRWLNEQGLNLGNSEEPATH